MKRIFFFVMASIMVLVSCETNTQPKLSYSTENTRPKVSVQQKKQYVIETIIDTCMVEVPNMMNNDVTKQAFADLLKTKLQKYCGTNLPFLNEIPMRYEMCLPYQGTDFYVVKFSEDIDDKDFDKFEVTFQVFSKMNKNDMINLIDKQRYYIDGIFVDFANNSAKTGFKLPSGKYLTDYPHVWKSSLDDRPTVNLGTLIIKDLKYYPCAN